MVRHIKFGNSIEGHQPDTRISRKSRVEFLVNNYVELQLANYPWGLDRNLLVPRHELYKRKLAIFRRLQSEKLLAPTTTYVNVNIHNLIIDARALYHSNSKN